MQILPDPFTIAVLMVPFLTTIVALYFIIFKPMLAYLDAREAALESGRLEAEGLQSQVAGRTAEYNQQLQVVRSEGAAASAEMRTEASKAYDEHMKIAKSEAAKIIEDATAGLSAEAEEARSQLHSQVDALADQIVGKVLHQAVG